MKVNIEIITGFLGSGKTIFLNSLLSETQIEDEKILIFQLEKGKSNVNINNNIKVIYIRELKNLNENILHEIDKYKPDRILIEFNGTSDINDLFKILNKKIYKKYIKISTIYFISDCIHLKEYLDNIGRFIIPFIKSANMIVLNNADNISKEQLEEYTRMVKQLNNNSYILIVDNKYTMKHDLSKAKVLDTGIIKKIKIKFKKYLDI